MFVFSMIIQTISFIMNNNTAFFISTSWKFLFIVLYNSTLSHKILRSDILSANLLQQLADYEPYIATANNSTLHHHKIFYPPHATLMGTVIGALENLPIFTANASTIESQVLVAEVLTHQYLSSLRNTQHGESCVYSLCYNYSVY